MKLYEMRKEIVSNANDIAASGIEMKKKGTSIVYCPFCDILKHQTKHIANKINNKIIQKHLQQQHQR